MKHEFFGFFQAETSPSILVSITDNAGTPKDPAVAPTYRVYEAGVLVPAATGSLTKCDTHTITGATNATPIQITTSAPHGLQTGDRVTVASVGGNAAANGDFTITKVGASTYTLNGSTGDGAYTSGGTGHVTGLYKIALTVGSAQGYTAGKNYSVAINWTDSAARAMTGSFIVT